MSFQTIPGSIKNAAGAAKNPAAGQIVIQDTTIPENRFDYLQVLGTMTVERTGTAGVNTQNIDVIDQSGPTTLHTVPIKTTAVAEHTTFSFNVPVVKRSKGTLRLAIRAGTADAQTTLILTSLNIAGIGLGKGARGK